MLLQYPPLLPPAAHPLPPVCRSRSSRAVFEGTIRRCSVGVWQHSREPPGNPGEDRCDQQHADFLHFRQRVGFNVYIYIYIAHISCGCAEFVRSCIYLCLTSSLWCHIFVPVIQPCVVLVFVQTWTDAHVPRRQRRPSEMWKRHHIWGRHERASHRLLAWDH